MEAERHQPTETLDPLSVKVQLSDQAKGAFRDLEAAVHFSDHFNGSILSVLKDIANGKNLSVADMLSALPVIASETFRHIHATGDQRAADAWRAVGEALTEYGFTLTTERRFQRGRSR